MQVVDIGGNIGFYSILLSRLVGGHGVVHVFEADTINFKHLKKNTQGLINVVINPRAAAERSGMIRLFRSNELNVDHQTYDIAENRDFVEIPYVALDDYFCNHERIDFIKINIQGYEYHAVLGMRETIVRSPSVAIFSEFWPYGLRKAGADPDDYLGLLKKLGVDLKFWHSPGGIDYREKLDDKDFYTNVYGIKK